MKKQGILFCLLSALLLSVIVLTSCASNGISYPGTPQVLRNSPPYGEGKIYVLPVVYNVDEVRAAEIRWYFAGQGLDLEAIAAADATTWEKVLTIATFVSQEIPHANQKRWQELGPAKNAISLWEYHLNIEKSFNCRWHAILLSELLLAAGIDARYVTCLPETDDDDCHVVNQVWLPELAKWAMIDSDGRHYVTATTAEAGIPLSIAEIRRALVAGEDLTVHTLVTPATSPAWYLNYLSKDFYWFEMANYVGFDVESWNPDTGTYEHPDVQWIQLRPLEYDDYAEGSEIITRSPSQFWAPPETYRLPCAEVENCIDFRYIEIE